MPTPTRVRETFKKRLETNLDLYRELLLAVHGKRRKDSLESMLAEQCLLGLCVLWEAFIHDLMVAYIEQSPESCLRFHKDRVTQSIKAKNEAFLRWTQITLPTALTQSQIESIVDPNGYNITADSAESLSTKANQLLSAPHAQKFSLPAADRAFVNLLIALRNNLSHRSAGSLSILRGRLVELSSEDAGSHLNGSVTTTGAYLKRQIGIDGLTRAEHFGRALLTLSSQLI